MRHVALLIGTAVILGLANGKEAEAEAEAEESSVYFWPDEELGPRSPELLKAGKKAAKYVGCFACLVPLSAFLSDFANGYSSALTNWLDAGHLDDAMTVSKDFCKPDHLITVLDKAHMELQTYADGTAGLKENPEYNWKPPSKTDKDQSFNWKVFAVQEACLETFRKDGSEIAKAFQEIWKTKKDSDDGSVDERIYQASQQACFQSKGCRSEMAEVEIESNMAKRQKIWEERDPEFAAMPLSEVQGEIPTRINLYTVLGVSEDATRAELQESYDLLVQLYGTQEGLDLAGISEEDSKRTMGVLKAALQVLSDRAARIMYDEYRERRTASEKFGLVKERERDRLGGFDGKAALAAYADEMEELKKLPIKNVLKTEL